MYNVFLSLVLFFRTHPFHGREGEKKGDVVHEVDRLDHPRSGIQFPFLRLKKDKWSGMLFSHQSEFQKEKFDSLLRLSLNSSPSEPRLSFWKNSES